LLSGFCRERPIAVNAIEQKPKMKQRIKKASRRRVYPNEYRVLPKSVFKEIFRNCRSEWRQSENAHQHSGNSRQKRYYP